jgi:hypothetical protein
MARNKTVESAMDRIFRMGFVTNHMTLWRGCNRKGRDFPSHIEIDTRDLRKVLSDLYNKTYKRGMEAGVRSYETYAWDGKEGLK